MNNRVLIITGPTASGKSAAAVEVAEALGGEIVSADSMQLYRGMDIGTAKPTDAEMKGVPHHLLGFLEPSETFCAADFKRLADETVTEIVSRGRLPVIVGGTGQYISAFTDNLVYGDIPSDASLRDSLTAEAKEKGGAAMKARLAECDPDTAARLHENDLRRIVRALEIFTLTGVTQTEYNRRSRLVPSRWDCRIAGLNYHDRALLYERIDSRVDAMVAAGLVGEAKRLYSADLGKTASQAIGYKELFAFFEGKTSYEEAVESIKRESRRYAKRQLCWFSRMNIKWFYRDSDCPDEIFKGICALAKE